MNEFQGEISIAYLSDSRYNLGTVFASIVKALDRKDCSSMLISCFDVHSDPRKSVCATAQMELTGLEYRKLISQITAGIDEEENMTVYFLFDA
jgi:hypothetical protein